MCQLLCDEFFLTKPRSQCGFEFIEGAVAQTALERARSGARSVFRISPHMIERFAEGMREKLRSAEVNFRKAQLGAIVERVEVDDEEVRILGRKDLLEEAVIGASASKGVVRRCVRGWLANQNASANQYVDVIPL
jgi:hypothetical protein